MRIHYRRSFADPDLVGDPPVLPAHYHEGHYLALAGVRVSQRAPQRGRSLLALQSRKVARESRVGPRRANLGRGGALVRNSIALPFIVLTDIGMLPRR